MLRGIYTSVSGMMANQRRSEMLTNNLANIHSPGYKAEEASFRSFPEYLLSSVQENPIGMKQTQPIGKLQQGVYTHELIPRFSQGDLQETQNPLDMAIYDEHLPWQVVDGKPQQPRLFYTVQKNEETFYTRASSFTLDAQNRLISGDESLLLDSEGQPITLPSDKFQVDERGFVYDEQGNPISGVRPDDQTAYPVQLGLVQINNPHDLIRTENNAFRWQGEGEPEQVAATTGGFQLRQGFMERSNVDAQQTMIDMMQTVRSFQNNEKVLSAYNQTLDRLFEASRLS